ncbi:MAG: DUF58 domain-containing protein [Planctomycetes bacterium]|nr:DUF58 domain-containing protein [Planctomycetota bacterium]
MATSSTALEPTLRGRVLLLLGLAAAAAAWLGDDPHARLAAALLLAPVLVDLAAKPRRLHATELRIGPRRTAAGAPFTEHLVLVNRGRTPLRDCLLAEPRTMRTDPPALLPALRPGAPVPALLRCRSLQRCHVLERVFVLATGWPLGLFRSRAVIAVAADLVTEPARVPLAAELLPAFAEREAAPRDRTVLPGPEFHSLREHQPGEDARGVHALRSASLGVLVRRVMHGRVPHTVGLVIDLRRPPGRPLGQASRRFEWSLGAAATLVARLRARAARIDVLLIDAEPARLCVLGMAQEHELLTLLAEASPTPHRPLPADQFDHLRRLEHCYWIPAGAFLAARDQAALPGTVTLVGGDLE